MITAVAAIIAGRILSVHSQYRRSMDSQLGPVKAHRIGDQKFFLLLNGAGNAWNIIHQGTIIGHMGFHIGMWPIFPTKRGPQIDQQWPDKRAQHHHKVARNSQPFWAGDFAQIEELFSKRDINRKINMLTPFLTSGRPM